MQLDLKRLGNTRIILTQQDEILTLRLLNYKILTLETKLFAIEVYLKYIKHNE